MSSSPLSPLYIPEILRLILGFRHILSPTDLLATSLVSRTWFEITRTVRWNEIELDTESWIDPYHQALVAQLQKHGAFVRILVLKECGADRARFNTVLSTMTNLQTLVIDRVMLHNNPSIPLRALDSILPALSQLRYLSLPHISSSSNGVETLLDICQSTKTRLRFLDLIDSELDDEALRVISESCTSLRSLDLSRNELVTFHNFFSGSPSSSSSSSSLFLETTMVGNSSAPIPISAGSELKSSLDWISPATTFTSDTTNASQPSTIDPYSGHTFSRHGDPGGNNSNIISNVNTNNAVSASSSLDHPSGQKQHQQTVLQHQRMIKRARKSSRLLKEDTAPFMHLEELGLVFCFGIANSDFQSLFRSLCPRSLSSLNLQFTNIEDSGLETLAASYGGGTQSSSTGGLTNIKLSYCSQITARGIRALVQNCPQLIELEFLSCDLVSADCFLGPTPWVCERLRRLEFTFHPTVLFQSSGRAPLNEGEEEENSAPNVVQQSPDPTQGQEHESNQLQQQATLDQSGDRPTKSKQTPIDGPHYQCNVCSINNNNYKQQVHEQHHHHPEEDAIDDDSSNINNGDVKQDHASVRKEYHAMFRQLKRLCHLRSLHIYNSPLLNGNGPGQDGCDDIGEAGGVGELAATATTTTTMSGVAEIDISSNTPSAIDDQDEQYEEEQDYSQQSGSGSGHGSSSEQANTLQHRVDLETTPSPSVEPPERRNRSPVPTGMSGLGPCGELALASAFSASSRVGDATTPKNDVDDAPIHPFSLKMGLKALGRLKELEALTLYERQSTVIGSREVRWIGKALPQLVLLQLRGAIGITDRSLHRLSSKRPSMKVQVCSLFENVCL